MEMRARAIAPHASSPWFTPFYIAVVAVGLGGLGWFAPRLGDTAWSLTLLWLGLILLTDLAPVRLPGGGYVTASSTLDLAGILLLGPVPVAVAEFAATLVVQLAFERRAPRKALFNACAFAGTVLVAGWVYTWLGGTPTATLVFPDVLGPLLGLGIVYFTLNTGLSSSAIAFWRGEHPWRVWQVNHRGTVVHLVAGLPMAVLLAIVVQAVGMWGLVLLVVPLFLARTSYQRYTEAKRDLVEFAGVLAGMIDEFDPYTCLHSQRVSAYSARIAREMGLSEREVERAEVGGLLHDIGKIEVSQRDIILKAGPLNPSERAQICRHADIGADILSRVGAFRTLSGIVRYHHERMDGRGYHHLPGREVPLAAKVVMVADAFDAMTTDRVYRKAMSVELALAELERHTGTQFYPPAVAAITRLVNRGEIPAGHIVGAAATSVTDAPAMVNAGLAELRR